MDLGDLSQACKLHARPPPAKHTGYFAVHQICRSENGQPHVILVASTQTMLKRWIEPDVACIDGGYKYNIMGYPVHLLGVVNPSGNFCVTGLGVTSGNKKPMVAEML
eukprot:12164172-Karenia_brevis.AAC.1